VVLFLNITFPLGHMQNARMRFFSWSGMGVLSAQEWMPAYASIRNSFPDSVVPKKSTLQRLVERYRETGSIGEKVVLVVLLF
jgi:hypothetical protein